MKEKRNKSLELPRLFLRVYYSKAFKVKIVENVSYIKITIKF